MGSVAICGQLTPSVPIKKVVEEKSGGYFRIAD